jgi:Family of unknown function (DUF6788)
MNNPAETTSIPPAVARLAAALSQPQPMRRGSINERHMKCGQASCPCQREAGARHGPYYTLTQAVDGKTRSRYLREDQVPTVRRQIAAGREFRQQAEAYWEVCERWADAELEQTSPAAPAAEKKGSKPYSRPRSRRKSKRS